MVIMMDLACLSLLFACHTPVQAKDLPFDGAVDKSISRASLRPGDVLLSTTGASASAAIRRFTQGPFSHAAIFVERTGELDWIVDSTTLAKVSRRSFTEAYRGARYVVVVRNERMSSADRTAVLNHALAQVGKEYDYVGAFASVGLRIGTKHISLGFINDKNRLYCSELVVDAFGSVGKPELAIARKGEALSPNSLRDLVWTNTWSCVGVIWPNAANEF